MYSIELMDNNSEIVKYNVPNMPIKSCTSRQEDYPTLSVIDHWHTDFEFSYLKKGTMLYNVNGEQCKLKAGDMIMVNSGQLHHGYWKNICECEFVCTIFHPSLLNENASKKYIDNICINSEPYYIFSRDNLNDRIVISPIDEINDFAEHPFDGHELEIMSRLYRLVYLLSEHFKSSNFKECTDRKKLDAMHKMVGFIQHNYSEKISLNDIAEAGIVCRSTCCSIFKQFLDKTPVEYLTEYRISKSLDMLHDARLNITEISFACGFSGASYFTETFSKIMKCTPSEYRKKHGIK